MFKAVKRIIVACMSLVIVIYYWLINLIAHLINLIAIWTLTSITFSHSLWSECCWWLLDNLNQIKSKLQIELHWKRNQTAASAFALLFLFDFYFVEIYAAI